jgi:hypothetical protein
LCAAIVFITGRGDIPTSVRAMKGGAMDFLTVCGDDLLTAVHSAIERDRRARALQAELDVLGQRLASLTPREREVLGHVVAGRLNKQIAGGPGHRGEDDQGAPRPDHGENGGAVARRSRPYRRATGDSGARSACASMIVAENATS